MVRALAFVAVHREVSLAARVLRRKPGLSLAPHVRLLRALRELGVTTIETHAARSTGRRCPVSSRTHAKVSPCFRIARSIRGRPAAGDTTQRPAVRG